MAHRQRRHLSAFPSLRWQLFFRRSARCLFGKSNNIYGFLLVFFGFYFLSLLFFFSLSLSLLFFSFFFFFLSFSNFIFILFFSFFFSLSFSDFIFFFYFSLFLLLPVFFSFIFLSFFVFFVFSDFFPLLFFSFFFFPSFSDFIFSSYFSLSFYFWLVSVMLAMHFLCVYALSREISSCNSWLPALARLTWNGCCVSRRRCWLRLRDVTIVPRGEPTAREGGIPKKMSTWITLLVSLCLRPRIGCGDA